MNQSKSGKERTILVSNAEPYKHETDENGEIICQELEGGLTTALNPHMRRTGGVWIASGRGKKDFEVTDSEGRIKVPSSKGSTKKDKYALKRMDFPNDQYRNFYEGYSNSILWPIFHSFPARAELDKENNYWSDGYLPTNKDYARAVINIYQSGDTVWVHDYHLALVPKLVREEIPEAEIGVFLHIPWPPWESYGKIPHREEILRGLMAADLVGLQLEEYVDNLFRCSDRVGAQVDRWAKRMKWDNQETQVGAYPLGVDYDFFNGWDSEDKQEPLRKKYDCEYIILGVDRQDYTKGIPERIKAFRNFLELNPEYLEDVILIQRTPLSRTGVEEYQKEKNRINHLVSEINGKYGNHEWTPINLFWDGVSQEELIEEYRAADICLVTPGLDGMNLVAKEFVAANVKPKALILSEFAGSSKQLKEALHVNVYDSEEVAKTIKKALKLSFDEKKRRWKNLRKTVKGQDLSTWSKDFLEDLNRAHLLQSMSRYTLPNK
ncbi:MAG: trehalose-6-phosphate synthase [Candidatus Bipolaricaulia bacterium]